MSLDVGLGGGTPVFIFCFRYLSDEVLQRLFWPVWGFTLPHPILLIRCGLPRNIPAFRRKMIRRRDNKADPFVKLYLSLYSISKCILVRERQGFGYRQRAPQKKLRDKCKCISLAERYAPVMFTIPRDAGFRWLSQWSSSPVGSVTSVKSRKLWTPLPRVEWGIFSLCVWGRAIF